MIYTCLFDFTGFIISNSLSCISHNFTGQRIDYRFWESMPCKTWSYTKFFIVFISSETAEVISFCIKEKIIKMCKCTFNRRRLARTEFLIYINKSVRIIFCLVFLKNSLLESLIFTEKLKYFFIRTHTQSTYKSSNRNFSVLVYTDIDNIIRIHLIFKPCTSVGDNSRTEQILTCFIFFKRIVNTRRTYKLWYNNTFCTIYNKRSTISHNWHVT